MTNYSIVTWYEALNHCQQNAVSYVLITVMQTAGSTPRNTDAKMVITATEQFDTIGGGHLEYQVIEQARHMLVNNETKQNIASFPLASKLGQCCGGAVKVLFECFCEHSRTIAVFGAGHVAKALVPIIAQLPVQIKWIDSRAEMFNDLNDNLNSRLPSNVDTLVDEHPVDQVSSLPTRSMIVILTHNHQLDFDLVQSALKNPEFSYVGMIGSSTKVSRFVTRLQNRGFSQQQIARLISPIGDLNIPGKKPIEVAVSISAQIIQRLDFQTQDEGGKQSVDTQALSLQTLKEH